MNPEQKFSVQQSFARLRSLALDKWQSLKRGGEPTILVGSATCGRASGALEIFKAFQEETQRAGIKAHLLQVGCLGHCYAEPLVIISRPGFPAIVYSRVNPGRRIMSI